MAETYNLNSLPSFSTPKKPNKTPIIQCLDDDDDDDNSTPLRPIFCLKHKSAIKEFDDKEDCFILDFNPEGEVNLCKNGSEKKGLEESPDICVVAEKGQVACRDYPHSRHLCVKLPFEKTSHETYCKLCFCYVCDVAAPCTLWTGTSGHCHAIDTEGWKYVRRTMRSIKNP